METTNTNFWRLRINIKNNNTLELCQIRLKDMTWDEYKSKYKMTEISDKDTLVNIMTEEFIERVSISVNHCSTKTVWKQTLFLSLKAMRN